jgi:hypothetical protein
MLQCTSLLIVPDGNLVTPTTSTRPTNRVGSYSRGQTFQPGEEKVAEASNKGKNNDKTLAGAGVFYMIVVVPPKIGQCTMAKRRYSRRRGGQNAYKF